MLSLAPGDLIATSQETAVCATASSPTGDTWWHGIDVHTGREGAFPAHCVTPIEGAEAAALRSPGTTSTTVSFAAEADKSKALREPDPPALLLAPPPARLLGRTVQWIRETPATTLLLLVHTLLLLAALAKEGDVVSLVKNPSLGVSGATLRALGACSQSHVHSGHVYLLLTHALLPVGFFRAVVDTAGVVLVTAPQEQRLGTRTAVLAWVIGTIGGGLCSCVFTSAWLFAGASVGVFASIGVDLAEVYLLRVVREGERERRGEARIAPAPPEVRQRVRRALVVVAVNLLLGGIPGQNNWAMVRVFSPVSPLRSRLSLFLLHPRPDRTMGQWCVTCALSPLLSRSFSPSFAFLIFPISLVIMYFVLFSALFLVQVDIFQPFCFLLFPHAY